MTNNINYGISSSISQLTGFLFFENVKIEKQRKNEKYNKIIPKFLKPRTFILGFYPYGLIQSFAKGYIFGFNQTYIKSKLKYSQNTNNLIIGATTGISEAIITSPIIYIRTNLTKNLIENSNEKINFNFLSILKGSYILILKRSIDWTTRFVCIDFVKKYSPIQNNIINTFIGASITSVFSSPIDRLLPLVYTNQSILKVLKEQGIRFAYNGFIFRTLSIGHYTTCLLILPDILNKILK